MDLKNACLIGRNKHLTVADRIGTFKNVPFVEINECLKVKIHNLAQIEEKMLFKVLNFTMSGPKNAFVTKPSCIF